MFLQNLIPSFLVVVSVVSNVQGQEQLRWKFTPGQQQTMAMTLGSETSGVPGAGSTNETVMWMSWNIDKVDSGGTAHITQEFHRVTVIAIHDLGYAEVALQPHELPGDMQLQPWASVEGVLYQSGKPVPSAEIELSPLRPRFGGMPDISDRFSTITDATGGFKMSHVPPVAAKLFARLRVGNDYPITSAESVPLDIQPGDHLSVNLGGDGGDVIGRAVVKDAVDQNFDYTYAVNWLVPISPGIKPSSAVAVKGYDTADGWNAEWRSTAEGNAFLDTLNNYFVKLKSDGTFLITGVSSGDYELAMHLYEPPDG